MNYTYLLAELGLLIVPVMLCLQKELKFQQNSKFIVLSLLINVFVFSVPTELLTQLKVIVFNPPYLTGTVLWQLPAEELMMLFILPFTGLSIYCYLNYRYPANALEKYSFALSNMLLGICVAMLYFGHSRWYTLLTFSLLLAFIVYIEYVSKIRFMYRFYRAWLISLIPFYLIYGILISRPVIQYNASETLRLDFGNIPFESQFYYMAMLLLTVYFFEFFKSRSVY